MKRIIITILALLLLVGVILSMANITDNIVNDINKPSKDNVTTPDDDNAGDDIEIDESLTVIDFDNVEFKNVEGTLDYISDIGNVYLKAGVFGVESGRLYMGTTPDTYESFINQGLTSIDPYAFIGPTIGVKDNLAIVYDIDVIVDEGYTNAFSIRPNYRAPDYTIAEAKNNLIFYQGGEIYLYQSSNNLMTGVPNGYHYTCVLWYDGTYDVYVNGQHIYRNDLAYSEQCVNVSGLRIHFKYTTDTDKEVGVHFDNLKIKTFALDYTGDILSLYDNPAADLHNNADTVLGGGY